MSQAGSNSSGGSGGSGIVTIDVDQGGSVTGATVDLFASLGDGSANAGATMAFLAASGTEIDLQTTDANGNIAIGNNTFLHNGTVDATFTTAVGQSACYWGQNLSFTTAIGFQAAASSGTGGTNTIANSTFIGADCATPVATTTDDTMVGYAIGNSYTGDGGENCVLGSQSIQGLVDGNNNVVVGFQSGNSWTTSESNNILISNNGVIGDQSIIRIGTQGSGSGQQDSTFVAGITGTTPTDANSPQVVVCDNTGNLTVVPDTTAGYVLTSNFPNSPTFQAAGAGSVTAFFAYLTGNMNNVTGDGTQVGVVFDTAPRNDSGIYDTSTGTFTPNKTGIWNINYGITYTGLTALTTNAYAFVYDATSTFEMAIFEGNLYPIVQTASPFYVNITASINAPLTSGDAINVLTGLIGDVSKVVSIIGDPGNYYTYFSAFYVG